MVRCQNHRSGYNPPNQLLKGDSLMYEHFSSVYDQLMDDAPYDEWLSYTGNYLKPGASVLDIACGTGTFTLELAKVGYQVQGTDISLDMLTIADAKARSANMQIPFIQQDMRNLEGFHNLDGATIFCDGLNYLHYKEEVNQTFSRVFQALRSGGEFLFDVHSPYKMEEIFNNQMYGENGEDISYLWFSEQGDEPLSVHHIMTFFKANDDGTYDRFDEEHYQRTFGPDQYERMLRAVGFTDIVMTSAFGKEDVKEETDRIFFRAKKK